jgi:hypothetical protein
LKDYNKLTYQEQLNKHEIIKQHLNKYQLKRAVDIHKKIYHKDMHKHINFNYLISDIIFNYYKNFKTRIDKKIKIILFKKK